MLFVDLIVGARPNFMKAAPILRAALARSDRLQVRLVHTGQHYDVQMNDNIFRDLELPVPNISLEVGSGSHAEQVARVMLAYEQVVLKNRPAATMVVGDVNSTLATALVCAKLHIPVIHLEAGLRSGDRRMPEEINRLATDTISDLLLTPSRDADQNLRHEGVSDHRIRFVGNVMIDNLRFQLDRARDLPVLTDLGLRTTANGVSPYILVTLHRPANVDDAKTLRDLLAALGNLAEQCPVFFPVHPRTRTRITEAGMDGLVTSLVLDQPQGRAVSRGLYALPPLPYNQFLALMNSAALVVTDSGGVQEETTALGVPCLTLRENTERPVTVTEGTNTVIGHDYEQLRLLAIEALAGRGKRGRIPEGWDGKTAERVIDVLLAWLPLQGA